MIHTICFSPRDVPSRHFHCFVASGVAFVVHSTISRCFISTFSIRRRHFSSVCVLRTHLVHHSKWFLILPKDQNSSIFVFCSVLLWAYFSLLLKRGDQSPSQKFKSCCFNFDAHSIKRASRTNKQIPASEKGLNQIKNK